MKNLLAKLGFPEYDSKILLYLTESGKYVDAKQISESSGVPLTRIYSIMLKLAKTNLIKTMPGKINLYAAPKRDELVKAIRAWKDIQIKEQVDNVNETCSLLSKQLHTSGKGAEDVNITYFHDNEAYWKEYLRIEKSLKRGFVHRIINNVRLCAGFVEEELAGMSKEQADVMRGEGIKGGADIVYIINPKSIIQNTMRDLPNKNRAAASIKRMLRELKHESEYSDFYIGEDTSSILIAISPECVFMEFYGSDSKKIASAIKIENKQIALDFAKWFDALASTCKKRGYEELEKEIVKLAKQHGL